MRSVNTFLGSLFLLSLVFGYGTIYDSMVFHETSTHKIFLGGCFFFILSLEYIFTRSQKSYFLKKLALDYILCCIWLTCTEETRNHQEEEISFFLCVLDYDTKFKLSFISKEQGMDLPNFHLQLGFWCRLA